jgi:selenocysteine-specific elongation factor
MRRLILGTAGHIDHGKTTVVRALTGVDTDRLKEEKRRGITIDLGFAQLKLGDDLELGVVDLPGHEAFIRNMLAGATGIDLALLVVAADEGVMPQTREHLAILELLGLHDGVVAITKTDLVDDEWLELVTADLESVLQGTAFAGAPLVPVSAKTGQGLDTLRRELAAVADTIVTRREDDLFRLPIDRVFSVHGTGTVVTGTIWSGAVERDQILQLLPAGERVRVRAIQRYGEAAGRAGAGERAALGLVGIERDRISRGDLLVDDGAWRSSSILTAELRLMADTPHPLRSRRRVRFHLGTAEVMARVVLLDHEELGPGSSGWVQLRLEAPIVARGGDRFVIRSYSPITTIGGGVIVEPAPLRRRGLTEAATAHLGTMAGGTIDDTLASLVDQAGWLGLSLERIPVESSSTPGEVAAAVDRLEGVALVRAHGLLFSASVAEAARHIFLEAIDTFHEAEPLRQGIDREKLRRALPRRAAPALGEWILDRLEGEGVISRRGAAVARAGFQPRLDGERRRLRDLLLETLNAAGLRPPPLTGLPPELRDHADLRPLLLILEEEGLVVELAAELYLSRAVRDQAVEELRRDLAGRGPLTVAEFREVIPLSRKYLIPLLEHFDQIGITERNGDSRTLSLQRA